MLKKSMLAIAITLTMVGCGGGGGDETPPPVIPDFTVSDMDGNWSLHGLTFGLGGNPGDGNFKGSVDVNASGDVTGGYFANSKGQEAPLTGDQFLMKDNGEFNSTVVAADQFHFVSHGGKMASSKDIFVGVQASTDFGSNDLATGIKQGGTFATSDLEGKWYMFAPSVGAEIGSPEGTIWGTFELDANGDVVGGDISTSDNMNMTVVGGALVMNGAGELTGTITSSVQGQDFDVTIDSGKMDPSKNIMFMTDQTGQPLNSNEMIAAVKSGGTFATSDIKGKWYLYGVSMGTSLGKVTISGYMEVDTDGKVTNGIYNSTGEATGLQPLSAKLVSGELSVDENGVVGGAVVAQINLGDGAFDTIIPIIAGKISASKNLSVMVTQDDEDTSFIIGIKGN